MDIDRETEAMTELPDEGSDLVDEGLSSVSLRDEDRMLLVMAYLGPLCLVPLLGQADPFVKWHARQGLAMSVVAAGLAVLLYPFHWLFSLVPFLGRLFSACELLLALGYLLLISLAVERALAGRRFRVPWLADLADQD